MNVKRCDACGGIGEHPYTGWLVVSSATGKRAGLFDRFYGGDTDDDTPSVRFDVCSHTSLPELAFSKIDDFVTVEKS